MNKIFVLLILVISSGCLASLPPTILPCPRHSHIKLSECVKSAIEHLRPQISSGILSSNLIFDEKLNPLSIGDVHTNKNFELKLFGTKLYGIQNFMIEKLKISADREFKLNMIINIPRIDGTARYSLKWIMSMLSLQGSGDHNFNMENTKVLIKIYGSRYHRGSVEYLKIDRCDVNIKAGVLKVYFDNLFNGNKAMEIAANDVINQNIDIIKGDVIPVFERELGKILLKISNQVFAIAPFNEFFPLN